MKFLSSIMIILFCSMSGAESLIKVQYGLGLGKGSSIDSGHKSINVGLYRDLEKVLSWNVHGGFLSDSNDKMSALYLFSQFGTTINPNEGIFINTYVGPGIITSTGSKLSGLLQFSINVGFGFKDPLTKNEIGINWKHISNAGLSRPNRGRDLILLSVGFSI